MTADPLIDRLNRDDRDGFVARIGTLYEHSPWMAAAAWAHRPFHDRSRPARGPCSAPCWTHPRPRSWR